MRKIQRRRGRNLRNLDPGRGGDGSRVLGLQEHRRDGRRFVGFFQHFIYDGFYRLAHAALVLKAHLPLVGMHIHVGAFIRHIQVQHAQGKFADHHPLAAAAFHGGGKQRAFHGAAIQEKVLMAAVAPADVADAHKAMQQHAVHGAFHPGHQFQRFHAVHAHDGAVQLPVAGAEIYQLLVRHEAEGHGGMGQDQPCHQFADGGGFRAGLFQEFPAHRRVVKQFLYGEGGAFGAGCLLDLQNFSALIAHQQAAVLSLGAGLANHFGDGSDRSQRFSPEPQGLNAVQILRRSDFAGSVTGEGHADVGRLDAAAVVGYPKRSQAAVPDIHSNGSGSGVHAVFHQFLDGGGRALHHFAGGNLTDHFRRQWTNVCVFHGLSL